MDRCQYCPHQEGEGIRFHGMTHLELALLEEWMHLYRFVDGIEIGSSGGGVQDFPYGGERRRTGLVAEALDDPILRDSSV
jgi:hypothetical protein